jgi:hypothetical protein
VASASMSIAFSRLATMKLLFSFCTLGGNCSELDDSDVHMVATCSPLRYLRAFRTLPAARPDASALEAFCQSTLTTEDACISVMGVSRISRAVYIVQEDDLSLNVIDITVWYRSVSADSRDATRSKVDGMSIVIGEILDCLKYPLDGESGQFDARS